MIIKVNYTVSNPIIKITYDETPIYVSTTSNPIYVSVNYGSSSSNGTVTSVGLTMPTAFTVTSSPITTSGTIAVTGSGITSQYVRGDGTLATFPSLTVYVPYTGALSTVNLGANNIYANAFYNSFTNITASGTQVVLTVNSAPEILVNGSGGQTIKLPDATTLSSGTIYSINNNQSSGAVLVNNNSNTLIVSIPSGGYAEVILIDNSIAAGTWDRHFQTPSNVSWSTNTFDYVGSITGATWNGSTVQPNRGGTGQSTYTDGQLLIGNSTGNTLSKSTITAGTGISITNGSGTITITNTSPSSGGTVTSVAALTLGTTGTDLSSSVATGTTTPIITLNVPTASATNRGALSSADWTTFNSKFTLPSLTSGSVLFSNGTTIAQDNANFFWDDTNNRLGIGTATPTAKFQVNSSTIGDILSLSESTSNTSFKVFSQSSPAGSIALELKTNSTTSGTGGAYAVIDGYSESWVNIVSRQASAGNKWWRFGNLGSSNYFAIQKLNDAATAITGTPLTIFSSTGNVLLQGLGTSTTDAGYRLDVNGTARVSGNATFGTLGSGTGMFWDNTNNSLGIGTATPSFQIHATGSIRGNALFSATNITVGSTSAATTSSIVDIISTTKGVLLPRMTTTQKNAIATPATGLMVFDTTLVKLCVYSGTAWETITSL